MNYHSLWEYLIIFGALAVALYLLYIFIKKYLIVIVGRTKNRFDDIVVRCVRRYYWYCAVFIALFVFSLVFPLPPHYRNALDKFISAGFIFLLLLFLSKLLLGWIAQKAEQEPELSPLVKPIRDISKIIIFTMGVLLILDNLGFSLTTIWTTLGIGSLAIGLALKDTIANFFSGLYIIIDRMIVPGDYVKLSTGDEGYVLNIGWRTTKINTLQNNLVIIPNSKIVESILTNFTRPDATLSFPIQVSVEYKNDPERVEKILFDEVSKGIREVEGAVDDVPPVVRFLPGMGESGLNFTIFVRARSFQEQFYVKHELQKRIFKRLEQENISIAYPTKVVYLKKNEN